MNTTEPRIYPQVSISGAPTIEFKHTGDVIVAELAGAKLYAEVRDPVYTDRNLGPAADLRVTARNGEVLADIIVNARAHRNLTENVMDVGSALLWSHWRYKQAPSNAGPG